MFYNNGSNGNDVGTGGAVSVVTVTVVAAVVVNRVVGEGGTRCFTTTAATETTRGQLGRGSKERRCLCYRCCELGRG